MPAYCEQTHHMFYLLLHSFDQRMALIKYLKRHRIQSVFHYLPLHLSRMGAKWGYKGGDCPVTEDVSNRLVRLPFYNELTKTDLTRVVDAVRMFDGGWPS